MLIRQSTPMAKKKYRCDAFYWIDMSEIYSEMTDEEQAACDACKGVISLGEKYIYQVIKDGNNDFYIFRANIVMDEICRKYDLYEL